jgi:hypothetical protein
LVDWSVVRLGGWSVGLVDWSVVRLGGWSVGLVDWSVVRLGGWSVGLVGRFGWLRCGEPIPHPRNIQTVQKLVVL